MKTKDKELDFLKDGPWDELYALTEHWMSDLQFYRDDLRFLQRLIDKYFIWITKPENLELVREIKKGLVQLNVAGEDLLKKMQRQRTKLAGLAEDPNQKDAGIIKTEHEHLEEGIMEYVKRFRRNRKEVFSITEYIMDSEQLADILKS